MDIVDARARAQALLQVIEATYALNILNRDEIVHTITRHTVEESKILKICTALNTWVALNAGPEGVVTVPLPMVIALAQQIDEQDENARPEIC
ncbi:MAG: hypothetical protein JW945_06375 [Methanomicrobia archaeon]|nr:hypothetical protein [Methanomicrobia archaeon]